MAFSYNRALIKTSSDFCPFLVRRVEEQGESLLFPILYLSLVVFFMGWLCFADWNLKGRVAFSVPGTGRTAPGRCDLVVAMAAESCSVVTLLNWVQAQGVWVMNKELELFCSSEQVGCCGNLSSSVVVLHVTAPWQPALSGTKCVPH